MDIVNLIATVGSIAALAGIVAYRFGRLEQKVNDLCERVKGIARMIGYMNPKPKEVNNPCSDPRKSES